MIGMWRVLGAGQSASVQWKLQWIELVTVLDQHASLAESVLIKVPSSSLFLWHVLYSPRLPTGGTGWIEMQSIWMDYMWKRAQEHQTAIYQPPLAASKLSSREFTKSV